jgi:nucleoside-diphosphate-sugar epimerase
LTPLINSAITVPIRRHQFTVFGSNGLIGRKLCAQISADGHEVIGLGRNDPLPQTPLGQIIYAVGITADFRQRPFDTIAAHVSFLSEILQGADFQSFLYLSSTRVYGDSADTREDAAIACRPTDPDHLYNLSKLAGESLTLHCGRPGTRVARLSNVVAPGCTSPNFLDSIVRDAVERRHVTLHSHPESSKDYVCLDDVVQVLPRISISGSQRIYNVAGGVALTHRQVLDVVAKQTASVVEIASENPAVPLPAVNIDRARSEFGYEPRRVLPELSRIIADLETHPCAA